MGYHRYDDLSGSSTLSQLEHQELKQNQNNTVNVLNLQTLYSILFLYYTVDSRYLKLAYLE